MRPTSQSVTVRILTVMQYRVANIGPVSGVRFSVRDKYAQTRTRINMYMTVLLPRKQSVRFAKYPNVFDGANFRFKME